MKITLCNADRPKVTHLTINNVKLIKQHIASFLVSYCDLSFSLLMDVWSISNMYLGNMHLNSSLMPVNRYVGQIV